MNKTKKFLQLSVGIDVSKDDFKVCMMGLLSDKSKKVVSSTHFANNVKGFEQFWQWAGKHSQKYGELALEFLMEATGVYHENLSWYLYEQKARVVIVLPNHAKAFFKSEGMKSKNDKIDAQGLAKMSLSKSLKPWQPVSPLLHRLRTQSRHYEGLQKNLNRVSNQLHALRHSHAADGLVVKQLEKHIAFLNKQIAQTKDALFKTAQEDPILYKRLQYLDSIYGVGLLTAITVVAETNGFALFSSQAQLTSFAGYDIVQNQSGKHFGKTKISKKGNSHIRRALFMPAFWAAKKAGPLQNLYNRIFERTKCKMKAYTALQRKLLCLMYTLWKKEEDFKEDYHKNNLVEEEILPLHEIVA